MSAQTPVAASSPAAVAGSVALAHDYLNQRGGAERVVLELASMWPQAPIYTSLYRPGSTFPEFRRYEVRTTPLDRLPVDRRFRALFALYPLAFRALGTLPQDVVISSSSGWAHGVRTRPDALHAVYCHTPARWLYADEHLAGSVARRALAPVTGVMRRWDRRAAWRADLYIANSEQVRERIERRYGIFAPVVYPPVDVDRFRPRPRGERLLVVSRLLPYKRVDAVVDAATRAGIGLDVVDTGPPLADLRPPSGPTVEFHGRLPDADVTALMEGCRALCLPGKEDFGMTPVEANAAGKPVVALAAGGALESLQDGVTGTFFNRHEPGEVLDAIRRCDRIDTPPDVISGMARRFSPAVFRARLLEVLQARMRASSR
jgi:glycosyltransferase involved in cell wall biosynthesis